MAMIIQSEPVIVVESQPAIIQPQVVQVVQAPPPPIIQTAPAIMQVSGPVVMQPNLREMPGRMKCTYCQHDMFTVTRSVNGVLTWTVFGVLFLFLIWPFCLIPFCVSSCRDVEHSCPYCHNVIHIYRRM